MPTLACRICGRVIYTTVSLESLFAEESRCPRCGNVLEVERRVDNRRKTERRGDPADVPGSSGSVERRTGERRKHTRRRDDNRPF